MNGTGSPVVIDPSLLAKIILTVIKDLSGKGIPLSAGNLAQVLAGHPKLKSMFSGAPAETAGAGLESAQELKYHRMYQAEMEKVAATRDLMSRAVLTLMRLTKTPDKPDLTAALGQLKSAVTKGGELGLVEEALKDVKNEIIKVEMGDPPAAVSGPSGDEAGEPSWNRSIFKELRDAYLEFIGDLDIDLDADYKNLVAELRTRLSQADDLEAILALRSETEAVVRRYAGQVFNERKKAAAFIALVAQRLTDLEARLKDSFEWMRAGCRANEEFNTRIEREISLTADGVQEADELETLKSMVLNKLNSISEAVKEKHDRDRAEAGEVDQRIGGVNQHVGGLKDEIKKVQTENRFLIQKLKHDTLTGALNRFAYEERLAAEISRFQRYQRPCAMILFDLDHFKDVNDNFGHVIGDKCLKETVRNIQTELRQNDTIARYGGDEFVILLPETDGVQGSEVADKIRKTIANIDFLVRGKKVPLTITCGVTEIRDTDPDGETVFNRADKALYQAKRAGRNRVCHL